MYEIDELASIVAMANEYEQLALTEDIRQNGQRDAAVLWHGKIVDGRCRQLACMTIGVDLLVIELDSSLSREEVASIVKSLNTRRNLTPTQKMMSAYKEQEVSGKSNEYTSKAWGIPLGSYKNARYVATNKPDVVEPLFNGKSVMIFDPDKGRDITTDKINTLARIIKKTEEMVSLIVDNSERITFSVDSWIKAEEGKKWYYSKMHSLQIPEEDIEVRMDYVELANFKFRLKDMS